MTIPALTDGIFAKYQGIDAGPAFSWPRSTGLEPDVGYVHLAREDFQRLIIKEDFFGQKTPSGANVTRVDEPGNGIFSSGTLEIRQVIDGEEFAAAWLNVIVTQRAMEAVFETEDDSEVFRVELTDVRELWRTRGLVTAWVNVRAPGAGGEPGGTVELADIIGNASIPIINPAAAYIPGSLRPPDGKVSSMRSPANVLGETTIVTRRLGNATPWTLVQVLEEIILPQLPTQPRLVRVPKDLEDANPIHHIWNGVLAREALREIMEEFSLELALNPDGTVSFWRDGEGDAQRVNATFAPRSVRKVLGKGFTAGVPINLEQIDTIKPRVSFHHVPASVVVLGAPIVQHRSVVLEAVGEVNGDTKPLAEALKDLGVTMGQANLYAVTIPSRRLALFPNFSPEIRRELDRWLYKWYQVPGGAYANAAFLPCMKKLPRVLGLDANLRSASVILETEPQVSVESSVPVNLFRAAQKGSFTGPQLQAALAAIANIATKTLVTINEGFKKKAAGRWRLDHQRGIVMFDFVQANYDAGGFSMGEKKISGPAKVELEYSYQVKPGPDDPMTLDTRYFSVFTRRTSDIAVDYLPRFDPAAGPIGGQVTTKSPPELSQLPFRQEGAVPTGGLVKVIERDDFQQINELSGITNKASLDKLSSQLARQEFARPNMTRGAILGFSRVDSFLNTGSVKSITIDSSDGVIEIRMYVGSREPTAPPVTRVLTRARGPDPVDQRQIANSLLLPSWLKRIGE